MVYFVLCINSIIHIIIFCKICNFCIFYICIFFIFCIFGGDGEVDFSFIPKRGLAVWRLTMVVAFSIGSINHYYTDQADFYAGLCGIGGWWPSRLFLIGFSITISFSLFQIYKLYKQKTLYKIYKV